MKKVILNPQQMKNTFQENKILISFIFFLSGFIFDFLTLSRIDSPITIIQHTIFLLFLGEMLFRLSLPPNKERKVFILFRPFKKYQFQIFHFVLGSLLGAYLLYFFTSASLATSLIFFLFIIFLVIANELPYFQNSALLFKYLAYQFCLYCYFIFLIPTVLGSANLYTFLASLAAGWSLSYLAFSRYEKVMGYSQSFNKTLAPSSLLLIFLLFLYIGKMIPPLPLSLQKIGVYRSIEKIENQYKLSYKRAFWKFWQRGEQEFSSLDNEPIYIFARIFSPNAFSGNVYFEWQRKNKKSQWKTWDKIKTTVQGGRTQGYRVYVKKSNYQEGDWRVRVLTSDSRELGRIYLSVDTTKPSADEIRIDWD